MTPRSPSFPHGPQCDRSELEAREERAAIAKAAATDYRRAPDMLSMLDVIKAGAADSGSVSWNDGPAPATVNNAARLQLPKPCPFCGEDPPLAAWKGHFSFIVGCESDACHVNPQVSGKTVSEAWQRWNMRDAKLSIGDGIADAAMTNQFDWDQFDWMREAVYEPPPVKYSERRALSARMFCVIAVMVIVGVALWAIN